MRNAASYRVCVIFRKTGTGKGIDCGMMPIFSHQEDDLDSFRTITCQLYTKGSAGQTQIAEAFGIKVQALERWVKRFRENGSNTFYRPPETRGNSTVLTPEVRTKAQLLLDTGASVSETARELGHRLRYGAQGDPTDNAQPAPGLPSVEVRCSESRINSTR